MSEDSILCMVFHESLRFTSGGKFILESEGRDKTITPRRAEKWFKKRYPRLSWNRMFKDANEWLEDERKKAAQSHETPSKGVKTGLNRG